MKIIPPHLCERIAHEVRGYFLCQKGSKLRESEPRWMLWGGNPLHSKKHTTFRRVLNISLQPTKRRARYAPILFTTCRILLNKPHDFLTAVLIHRPLNIIIPTYHDSGDATRSLLFRGARPRSDETRRARQRGSGLVGNNRQGATGARPFRGLRP